MTDQSIFVTIIILSTICFLLCIYYEIRSIIKWNKRFKRIDKLNIELKNIGKEIKEICNDINIELITLEKEMNTETNLIDNNIYTHLVEGEMSKLKIEVQDERGAGNANHRYDITGFDTETNQSSTLSNGYKSSFSRLIILFQNGPLLENEPNGITIESLLAVCAHRLQGFQDGKFASKYNQDALDKINSALSDLQQRTKLRIEQNVKNTNLEHKE